MDDGCGAFLTDFGLAKPVVTGSKLTKTGQALGTPAYMSPEQARGEISTLTLATDVWSLGCVLYEMLAGSPPFEGETSAAVVGQVLLAEPPSLRRLRDDAPAGIERVLRSCLVKRAGGRYPTAADLREDLARILRDRAPLGRSGRRPTWAVLAGVALVVLAVWAARRGPSNPEETGRGEAAAPPAEPPRRRAEALASRARQLRAADPEAALRLLDEAARSAGADSALRRERAEALRTAGRWREAEAEYRLLLQAAPLDQALRFDAALTRWVGRQLRYDDLPDPREALEQAASAGSGGDASLARAILAYQERRWDEGERHLAEAPDAWATCIVRALLRHHEGDGSPEDQRRAVRDFDRALELGPCVPWLVAERAHARHLAGDHAGAVGDYTEALRLDPSYRSLLANRAASKFRLGDLSGALADFDAALEADPRDWMALSGRGAVHCAREDYPRAIRDFEATLVLAPDDYKSHGGLGGVLFLVGDHARAIPHLREALRLAPADPTVTEGYRELLAGCEARLAGAREGGR